MTRPSLTRAAWLASELSQRPTSKGASGWTMQRLRWARGDMALKAAAPRPTEPRSNHLLIVDSTFPNPQIDSGSDRIVRIANMSASLGRPTILASITHRAWTAIGTADFENPHAEAEPTSWDPELFWSWIDNSSTIWLSHPDSAGRLLPVLTAHRPGRRIIFDTTDLAHMRIKRKAAITGSRRDRLSARAFRWLETSAIREADMTIVVTEDEMRVASKLVPGADIRVVPNVHETRIDTPPGRSERKGLIFYGNYRHSPNIDAVRHLYATVMPTIWQEVPDATLTIIGDKLPEELRTPPDDRIHVAGWVDDLHPVLDGAVALIAPLRYGAGMKGKIGLAMANGLPVVTTSIGAEGMRLTNGLDALIADADDDLAAKCVQVLTDNLLWSTLSTTALKTLRSTLSAEAIMPLLEAAIGE